jgi:hypothetical protein
MLGTGDSAPARMGADCGACVRFAFDSTTGAVGITDWNRTTNVGMPKKDL